MEGSSEAAGSRPAVGGHRVVPARTLHSLPLAEALGSADLLRNLVIRELRATYKGSVLGVLWSLVNPLVTMAIFSVVFGLFLKIQAPEGYRGARSFAAFLLVGLLPWNLLSLAMTAGAQSLVANANLIRKVYFFRAVLPVSTVVAHTVHFAIGMALLLPFLAVLGLVHWANLWLLAVPMVALVLLASGLAFLTGVSNVYYRDTQYLASLFGMAWFYATPIAYPPEFVRSAGEPWITLCRFNPAASLVATFRTILYEGRRPDLWSLLGCLGSAAAVFLLGWIVFRRAEPRLAEEV
jgi:ABC-type polysaccharide/polyol phosphate export permease